MSGDVLEVGAVVGARYRVEACLGRGPLGYSYLAHDLKESGVAVVLKEVLLPGGEEHDSQVLLQRLARLSTLGHPGLARLRDFGAIDNPRRLFLVRDHLQGEASSQVLASADCEAIIEILIQLCRTLQFLHRHGMTHGNIKDTNVFLARRTGERMEAVLADFGLGGVAAVSAFSSASIAWRAPEVLVGYAESPRSDLYSLGVLSYFLLARHLPFEDEDPGYLIQKSLQGSPDYRKLEGMESGPALVQVIRNLMEKNPEQRPTSAEEVIRLLSVARARDYTRVVPELPRSHFGTSAFVDRKEEMALLAERAQRVRASGQGWTVFVTGESGSGKSRCMAEFRIAALLQGWRVFESDCLRSEDQAYGPFRRFLQWTDSVYPAETTEGRESHGVPGLADPPPMDPQAQGMVAETAVGRYRDLITRELVRRISVRPTIFMLHDCHWADEATAAVLAYLISDIRAHPVMILVSYRAGEARGTWFSRVVEQAKRQEQAEVLALSALDPDAVKAMVASMTGETGLGDVLGPWIHRSSGGNPLFVEEILKQLAEKGGIARESGRWVVREGRLEELEVPSGVAVVLRKRLEQLSLPERRIVEWLAVSGRAMPAPMLRDLCGMSREVFAAALQDLAVRQIVESVGRLDTDHIAFRHAVIAEVIRGGVAASRRRRMHIRIGEALENSGAGERRVTELARHYTEGRAGDKAVRYALQAAQACRGEYSNEAALRFYEYVLAHGDSLPFEVRCEAALEASDACCLLGLPRRALRILKKYASAVDNAAPSVLKSKSLQSYARVYQLVGNIELSCRAAEEGLLILDSHGKPDDQLADLRAQLLSQLAFSRMADSDTRAGLELVTQAISCAKSPQLIGHLNILIAGLHWVACCYREGTKASLRAIEILKPMNAVYLLPMAYSHAGINLAAQGRYGLALEYHNRALIHARKTRSPYLNIQALANMTEAYCKSGQPGLALEISRDLAALAKSVANRSLAVSCQLCNAELLITGLRFREAYRKLLQIVSSRCHGIPEYVRVQALALSAWLHVELGNYIPARKYIEAIGVMGFSSKNLYEIELARIFEAQILVSEGHVAEAKKLLDDVLSHARKARWEMHVLMARIWLAKCAMLLGQLDEARLIARRAMRLSIIMPAYRYQAEAHLLLGRIAIARTNGISPSSPNGERLCTRKGEKTNDDYLHHLQEAIRLSKREGFLDIELQARTELARVGMLMQRLDYCMDNLARADEAMNLLLSVVPRNLRTRYAERIGIVAARKILTEIRRECEYEVAAQKCNVNILETTQLRSIDRIARNISRLHNTSEICDVLVERLFDIEELCRIVVFLGTGDDRLFRTAVERVRDDKWRCGDRAYEIDVVRSVFRSEQPFISANRASDLRFHKIDGRVDKREMALLCMPLKAWGLVVGVLYGEGRAFDGGVSEWIIHYVSAICNIAAMGLVSAKGYEDRVRQQTILSRQMCLRNNSYNEIIGVSTAVCQVREHMAAVAMAPTDVLICGETGTGKELVARGLHRTGKRAGGVFVAIDCGSLTDSLAESELFGYREGAFTGAKESRAGLFEAAHGGVVFLDEVSNLPMRLQSKLLRVLQEREVRRIGEIKPRKIDVQIIAATNKDLLAEIEKGKFRRDLYHRLNVMQIRVPPLRDRTEDIPILIDWFLGNLAQREGGQVKTFSNEARQVLMEYPYPGNVRELAHIVESSYYLARGRVIQVGDLPGEVRNMETMGNSTWNSESHALMILRRIDKGEGNFLDLVKIPFLRHRIGVDVVRRLLHKVLMDAGGLYKSAFQRLGIPDREYATVKQFLKRNGCYLDFRPYRQRGSR